jgi:hypothetical protein
LNRRNLVVLLFDASASSPRALYRARRDASRLVQESRPGHTFAVASSRLAPLARPDLSPSDLCYSLSLDTGGAVTSTLAQLEELNRVTYMLGFRPTRAKRGSNDIKVRVNLAVHGVVGFSAERRRSHGSVSLRFI